MLFTTVYTWNAGVSLQQVRACADALRVSLVRIVIGARVATLQVLATITHGVDGDSTGFTQL